MSLLTLAIEYLILHTIFESIRSNDEEQRTKALQMLNEWTPLTQEEINRITYYTSRHRR